MTLFSNYWLKLVIDFSIIQKVESEEALFFSDYTRLDKMEDKQMKKLWFIFSVLILSIGLTACADKGENKETAGASEDTADSKTDAKKELMKFYVSITQSINEVDGDLNAYELSETEPTAEMKTKASESAAAVAENLKKIEVPANLKDQKADLEAAIKDLQASYETKAEELKKDAPSLDATNETFMKADEKIGSLFESVDLMKSSINAEVNS